MAGAGFRDLMTDEHVNKAEDLEIQSRTRARCTPHPDSSFAHDLVCLSAPLSSVHSLVLPQRKRRAARPGVPTLVFRFVDVLRGSGAAYRLAAGRCVGGDRALRGTAVSTPADNSARRRGTLVLAQGPELAVVGLYLIVLVVLGWLGYRRREKNSLGDFYLAGSGLGFFVLLATLYATQYSGNTFLSFPGEAYRIGFAWISIVAMMRRP